MATCIDTVLFDLDDVLADCSGDIMRHMGLSDFDMSRDYPVHIGRDIINAYAHLTGIGYEVPVFWEHFKREFWADIEPSPYLHHMLYLAQDLVPRENIAICTSPTKCGDCLAGKLDWIEKYIPSWMQRQFIITPRKHFCARPGTVLFDDCVENVEAFKEAGGAAVAFPAPWNENRGRHVPTFLQDVFDKLSAGATL